MKTKTADLIGPALDWAVTTIENPDALRYGLSDWREARTRTVRLGEYMHRYHQSWDQGGSIIDREKYEISNGANGERVAHGEFQKYGIGPTSLVAAMRCYVASKLGDEVDVPEELLKWPGSTTS